MPMVEKNIDGKAVYLLNIEDDTDMFHSDVCYHKTHTVDNRTRDINHLEIPTERSPDLLICSKRRSPTYGCHHKCSKFLISATVPAKGLRYKGLDFDKTYYLYYSEETNGNLILIPLSTIGIPENEAEKISDFVGKHLQEILA